MTMFILSKKQREKVNQLRASGKLEEANALVMKFVKQDQAKAIRFMAKAK